MFHSSGPIIDKKSFKEKKHISFKEASEIGKKVIELYEQEQFDKCFIFYNKFKNVISQIPQQQQVIPAKVENKNKIVETFGEERKIYIKHRGITPFIASWRLGYQCNKLFF